MHVSPFGDLLVGEVVVAALGEELDSGGEDRAADSGAAAPWPPADCPCGGLGRTAGSGGSHDRETITTSVALDVQGVVLSIMQHVMT